MHKIGELHGRYNLAWHTQERLDAWRGHHERLPAPVRPAKHGGAHTVGESARHQRLLHQVHTQFVAARCRQSLKRQQRVCEHQDKLLIVGVWHQRQHKHSAHVRGRHETLQLVQQLWNVHFVE